MQSLKKYITRILSVSLLFISACVSGQELNCIVTINATQIQTSDRGIFNDMKISVEQFMNGRKWTTDSYKSFEKIKCNMQITITKMPSIGSFSASVQVQTARPIFGTDYTSLILNFADRDWEFEYIESLPLEFNDNTYTTNLTSMLAFYAYIIVGCDYDTFSEYGGSPHFQKALAVVNNAQQSNRPGWQSLGSNRNRYWLMENLNNPQMQDVRKAMYKYHRLGMDTMQKNADQSREVIVQCLKDVKKVRDLIPNSILVVSFMDAKSKELANIFSEGNIQVRRQAYDLITVIDPTNSSLYSQIIQN